MHWRVLNRTVKWAWLCFWKLLGLECKTDLWSIRVRVTSQLCTPWETCWNLPFFGYLLDLSSHEESMLFFFLKVSQFTKDMLSPTLPPLIHTTTSWEKINTISLFYNWEQRGSENISIYLWYTLFVGETK